MIIKNNFYVITGGPGSGKTSLLQELQFRGVRCVPEVAREIIREQVFKDSNVVPWKDAKAYSMVMLQHSVRDFISLMNTEELHFFDRGIPDAYGYAQLMNVDQEEMLLRSVNNYRYNRTVFILTPWADIYVNDQERKQDFKIAVETYLILRATYSRLSYKIVEVPCLPVFQRADFVLNNIDQQHGISKR